MRHASCVAVVGMMAGALNEKQQLAQKVYATLQAVACPLVEGLFLQEADSMEELLSTPSQHRTEILAWIITSISPSFHKKLRSLRPKEPDTLTRELAALGQEMLLCRADDLDLIRGSACPLRQLRFMEQLLIPVPGSAGTTGEGKADGEGLLTELFAPESLPHCTHILNPTLQPLPVDIRAPKKVQRSPPRPEEAADLTALLLSSQNVLQQLQSECEFLHCQAPGAGVFSACALRVAVSDLAQLMAAFTRVYETDFRAYCSRAPPSLSAETRTFARVHQLLLARNTELDMLKQLSELSVCTSETVKQVHTNPRYFSHGEKRTLPARLEELTRRYREFLSLHHDHQ